MFLTNICCSTSTKTRVYPTVTLDFLFRLLLKSTPSSGTTCPYLWLSSLLVSLVSFALSSFTVTFLVSSLLCFCYSIVMASPLDAPLILCQNLLLLFFSLRWSSSLRCLRPSSSCSSSGHGLSGSTDTQEQELCTMPLYAYVCVCVRVCVQAVPSGQTGSDSHWGKQVSINRSYRRQWDTSGGHFDT